MKTIYFEYIDENYGQITLCDEDGNKDNVVNLNNISENEFKKLFDIFDQYSNDNTSYGDN